MFQFLNPIALFGILGISIPFFIHLWNVKNGKVLKVGSIAFLKDSATQRSRSLRFTEIPLLILRCLLIITLSFLLAQPIWKRLIRQEHVQGWLMMERQEVKIAYRTFQPAVDSLIQLGYELHYFNKGFEKTSLHDTTSALSESSVNFQPSYWSLLRELTESVPQDLQVTLITPNRLDRFKGTKPQIGFNLNWLVYNPGDSLKDQLNTAWRISSDSIRITKLTSTQTSSYFTSQTIPASGNSQYRVANENDKPVLISGNGKIIIDTSKIIVVIYAEHQAEAGYLKAALDAIQQSTGLPITATITNQAQDIGPQTDYLFWLSDAPLPEHIPACTFYYSKGRELKQSSWLVDPQSFNLSGEDILTSRVFIDTTITHTEILWRDGYGHSLLNQVDTGAQSGNRLYSITPPGPAFWESSRFPELIYDLLRKKDTLNKPDLRQIDPSQIQPLPTASRTSDKTNLMETVKLDIGFWWLAFLLFCLERFVQSRMVKSPKLQAHSS